MPPHQAALSWEGWGWGGWTNFRLVRGRLDQL